MDRGDCQGSLHSSWSRVRPCDGTWGQSPFSFMGVQLSGGPTWHPFSGVLEVIWGLPEYVSTRHGLYRWWHVDTGSSGGRTTSSGSRTSSPSSIATRSVYSHCYDVLNEDYLIISWYLHVWQGVTVARNPPTCPAEKRSLGENLVYDRWIWCSAQVRLLMERKGDSISLFEISPGIGWRADYMQPLLLCSIHEDTT